MFSVDCSSRASASVHAVQNAAPSPFDQYKAGFPPLTTVLSISTCRIFWATSNIRKIEMERQLTDPLQKGMNTYVSPLRAKYEGRLTGLHTSAPVASFPAQGLRYFSTWR